MKMYRWAVGCVLFLVIAVAGVGLHALWPFMAFPTTEISIQRLQPLVAEPQESMLAGVAVRDITTPFGIPKMGYSAWARKADGFRTRLKTKAFYIKPKQGLPVAIVQADLPASSLILHHRVAELIAAKTDIPAQSLSIHVTHTHSGPGQFLASDFYNAFGSNKPGFDPDVFNLIAQQMADALIEAYETRRPAKVAVGQTELYGAAKNRSIGAYILNDNVADKSLSEANALRAVNPAMTMVRIDVQEGDEFLPLGAFTTFAVHSTGIPPFTKPYHGDVWAFFERDIEWQIKRRYNTPWQPIHGPFESAHADNNPNYEPGLRGDLETRRLGKLMAAAGWELFKRLDAELKDDLVVASAMRELDVLNLRPQDAKGLCDRAVAGAATAGAATGDEVFPISYIPPLRRGWPKTGSDDCHAEKNYMMSRLQPMALEAERFPHLLSVSAHRIGDLVMVGLPFEVTFEAGHRIAQAMSEAVTAPDNTLWVVSSNANGYFGYATTREEYSAQWYEGGHTIYGPGTTAFLKEEAAKIVADMFTQPGLADMPKAWHFSLATQRFFPPQEPASGQRRQVASPQFSEAGNNKEAYWFVRYQDVNPSKMNLHQPLFHVQHRPSPSDPWRTAEFNNIPVNDEGYDLQIVLLEEGQHGMATYELRWFNPTPKNGEFRFAVASREQMAEFYTDSFSLQ